MKAIREILDSIKDLFLHGLLVVLPIIMTVGIIHVTFATLLRWLSPLKTIIPKEIHIVPFIEVLLPLCLILFIGYLSRFYVISNVWKLLENGIKDVPLLRALYFGTKHLTESLSNREKDAHQYPVLVEYPYKGFYSIGFLTEEIPQDLAPNNEIGWWSVFLPATPNPTSGAYIMVHEKNYVKLGITKHAALSFIISAGIIKPEH